MRAAHAWFDALPAKLDAKRTEIANRILKEIRERLSFLVDVGLDYLTLARAAGHACRAAKASASGSPRRSARASPACSMCSTSRRSACISATTRACSTRCGGCAISATRVIVVEHDEDAILAADYVVDVGPGAGIHGGEIVSQGTAGRDHGRPDIR